MSNDETIAQTYGRDAVRSVDNIAKALEFLAARLRENAQHMALGNGKAASTAADIVNDYTNGVGNNATRLYTLITSAADSDKHFAAEQSRAGREDA